MMAELSITPPRPDRHVAMSESTSPLNLVAVASEPVRRGCEGDECELAPVVSFKLRASGAEPRRARYTRIAARAVGASAAWIKERSGRPPSHNCLAGALVVSPGDISRLPQSQSGILQLLQQEESTRPDHKGIATAIVGLRSADAVIAGPFSPEDAQAPGLVPHLADLASRAYRALRPSAELIAHSGFGQIARRFQFIQMSHDDARWLASGAIDIGVLAQCLRQLQGGQGEFAITSFRNHGVVWADDRWWEIDPIGDDVNEARAGAAFTAAWVVARRFFRASAAKALSYARSAALNSTLKERSEV
jgi:hypothetical protein